ncbi:YjfB family protein [Bacillus mesophilum]|uniref:Putative motility protein n=1 Tax=Bacillus mesophilum TaxID=1071718 RepID=A0A7V7UTT0_9BACI|nr:YjfB family protein [Bacillus mesophilum]KAB2331063.1 putative motility protein [Bacillus mesophilum]
MDIAALSIALSQSSASQSAGILLTKKALDTAEGNSTQLLKMIEAPHPNLGGTIDVKA